MPGDYSRKIFDRKKHYRGVLMQQGRVQLDADWNEQLDLQLYRAETESTDVIGLCGAPKRGNGFEITTNGDDLLITPGRIYVEGLLCELELSQSAMTGYTNQPYYPNPEFTTSVSSPPGSRQLQLANGTYLVYLDAWQREITALDDPLIREKALGGPDTTARLQTVWQARLLRVTTNEGAVSCKTPPLPEYLLQIAAGTGKMTAQTKPPDSQKDPCQLPPQAGYLRLENQLYRVEVHAGGDRSVATFKWSRDNATVESLVEQVQGSIVTVSEIGKDEVLSFHDGDWVELVTEESTLNRTPNPLVEIEHVDPATREITLKNSVQSFASIRPLKLRRWDQTGTNANATGVRTNLANWIDLEAGIQVNFSAGSYRAGDYWLIPARTATGEIEWPPFNVPNTNPESLPPVGHKHHYCKLALVRVVNGVIQEPEDCRKRFPALTELMAEDVGFDNNHCKLAGADTVQEAIDRLCEARDLRHHNKHLHGWGIVCGLQVECGPNKTGQPRQHVTVRKGYAIDCEGNDIILDRDEPLDALALSAMLGSPPSSPPFTLTDGELALFIQLDQQNRHQFRLERYTPPKNKWMAALEGTLLMDFINECVLHLADFFRDQFTEKPGSTKSPAGPAQRRLSTALNLIVQLINTENGSFVFLSREEDRILRAFYNDLRALLQSHTFCAMFDGARPFPPNYPFPKADVTTIFSKGSQRRLRVSPNSILAYAVGSNNKIGIFDLKTEEMIAELDFPAGSGAVVKDVAFSPNGNQVYAVAVMNGKDSILAVADVSGNDHKWRQTTATITDAQLVTLGVAHSLSANTVYAIGLGKGLYEINVTAAALAPKLVSVFNATGHLAILEAAGLTTAFAAANATGAAGATTSLYNQIAPINLRSPANTPQPILLPTVNNQPVFGQDDIAISPGGGGRENPRLYVVINPPTGLTTKHVMTFDAVGHKFTGTTDLEEKDTNSELRLIFDPTTKRMTVSYEEGYRLRLLDANDRLEANFRFPLQIGPVSIAHVEKTQRIYALNSASNTITSISAELLDPKQQLSMQALVDYRTAALNAFFDLAGGLLQYLKDCLCDHFLVNCPTCDSGDKIYLAVISIRDRQVYKVCNFSLRKHVNSFPKVEYLLSLVPIIPLFTKLVEEFCCAALPSFFGKRAAPSAKVGDTTAALVANNQVKGAQIRGAMDFVKDANLRAIWSESVAKFKSGGSLFLNTITKDGEPKPAPKPTIAHGEIAGQPVEDARRKLAAAKINVAAVEPLDPNAGLKNLVEFGRAPLRLEEGAQIRLITKGDRVLYYARVEPESPQIKSLREEVATAKDAAVKDAMAEAAKLQAELGALKLQMTEMGKKHQEALASRDKEIAELKVSAKDIKGAVQAVNELKKEVAKLAQKDITRPIKKDKPK